MFRSIVVGVDGRAGGEDAIALARRLADTNAELVLTEVVATSRFAGRAANRDYDATLLADAGARLKARASAIDDRRTQIAAVPAESVAIGLTETAAEHDADLIVVGSCARGVVGRLLAGNDAQDTMHSALCPVAIAAHGYASEHHPKINRIGVGYDESAESDHALGLALAMREELGGQVEVVEILPPPWPVDMAWAGVPTLHEERKAAEARLLAMDGVDRSRVRVAARAFVELRDLASRSDLLVIGARPHSAFGRFALGSTSDALAHDLPASLLTVPRVEVAAALPHDVATTTG